MKYYVEFWKRAFDFKGVASRMQYWMAFLFNIIIVFVISLVLAFTDDSGNALEIFSAIYSIAILIPSISISIRRLHDHNMSGWLYLISLVPIVGSIIVFIFMLLGTIKEDNRWRMYDIQRGYIKENLFDRPLADNQW